MLFPVLDGLKLHKVLVRTIKEFVDDEMPTYASALACQMLFSLFPFLRKQERKQQKQGR